MRITAVTAVTGYSTDGAIYKACDEREGTAFIKKASEFNHCDEATVIRRLEALKNVSYSLYENTELYIFATPKKKAPSGKSAIQVQCRICGKRGTKWGYGFTTAPNAAVCDDCA